jgi:L-amino acid N-acyltransferase YncA
MKHTTDFVIRPALREDWEQILAIYNYYILNSVCNFEYDAYTLSSRACWFEQFQHQSMHQLLVGTHLHQVAGYIATTPFSQVSGYYTSANVSIYCHPQYTRSGLGSKLLKALIDASHSTGIHKLYAGITVPNNPSVQLFTKYGFIQSGYFKEVGFKFNQYLDVVWFEKFIRRINGNPQQL